MVFTDFLDEDALVKYWNTASFDIHRKYRSMLEVALACMLNSETVPIVADSKFFDFFKKKISALHLPVDRKMCYEVDCIAMFVCARKIGYYLGDARGTPELAVYQKLVKLLGELTVVESDILLRVLEEKTGPIQLLASRVTMENINWFMNKLKITNSVALIHDFFGSPSLMGKFNAIFKLLELHDMLWKSINWELAQQFVEFVYGIIAWLMEKTSMGVEMAKKGYNWVKAKLEGTTDEVEPEIQEAILRVEKQAAEEVKDEPPTVVIKPFKDSVEITKVLPVKEERSVLCHCNQPPLFGCGNCKKHWCMACNTSGVRCKCVTPTVHAFGTNCCVESNQDCLFRAVAAHSGHTVDDLKQAIRNYIADTSACSAKYDLYSGVQRFDEIIANVKSQLETSCMCEMDTVFCLSCFLPFNIAVYTNNSVLVNKDFDINGPVCWIHLDQKYSHFEHSPVQPDLAGYAWSTYFGGLFTPTTLSRSESESSFSSTESREDAILRACGIDISGPKAKPVAEVKPMKAAAVEITESLDSTPIGTRIKEWLEKTFTDVCKFFENNPIVGALTALISGIATFLGFTLPIVSSGLEKNTLIKRFSDATRTIYYAQKGTEGITKAFQETIGAVKDVFGISTNQEVVKFKEHVAEMYKMANEMSHKAAVNPGEFINDGQKFLMFRKKMEDITNTYMSLSKFTSKQDLAVITPIWYALSRAFQDLSNVYNKFMAGLADRQEPVTIWLWGESDVGKSQLCSYLIDKVNEASNRPNLQTMTISKGPEFWNTYCQQAHIKIDDFMSYCGQEGDLDSLAFFNLATCASYNPSMAHLNDKNTMANPLFVWVASNYSTLALNSNITNIVAFERRRNVFINVSWPEHSKCPKGRYDCEHWKGKTVNNFDHLTLTACNPNITELNKNQQVTLVKGKKIVKDSFSKTALTDEEIVADGTRVTIDEVVKAILACEARHNQKFQDIIRRKQRIGTIDIRKEAEIPIWDKMPNVFLTGPPGTGKSYILAGVAQRLVARELGVVHIKKAEEFESWAEKDFPPLHKTTIIDDLSTHLEHPKIGVLFDKIKERYDMAAVDLDVWIIGVNPGPTRDCIHNKLNKGDEYYDMIFRRGKAVTCSFKRRFGLFGFTSYSHADTAKVVGNIEGYVEYYVGACKMPQQGIIEMLSTHVPEVTISNLKDKLAVRENIKPSISCIVPMSSKDFVVMINNTSVASIISFLTSSKTQMFTTSLTVVEIGRKILQIVNNAKDYLGVNFTSMEDFLLQCWNNNFLTPFKGETILFKCLDASFYIDGRVNDMEVGVIWMPEHEVDNAITSMAVAAQTISAMDLSKIAASRMPPWFCLIGDLIKTCFMTMASGVVAASCVEQQQQAHMAVKYAIELKEFFGDVTKREMEGVPASIKSRLYPGVSDIRADQYASIEDDDLLSKYRESGKTYEKLDKNRNKAETMTESGKTYDKYDKSRTKAESKIKKKFKHISQEYADRAFDHNVVRTGKIPEVKTECCVELAGDVERAVAEVVTDPSLPSILKRITGNLCSICDSTGKHYCYGLFVKGNLVTTVLHVLPAVDNLRVMDSTGKLWHTKVAFKDPIIDRLDLVVTDKGFESKPNIVAHLSPKTCTPATDSEAVLVCLSQEFIRGTPTLYLRSYKVGIMRHMTYSGDNSMGYYHLSYKGHKVGYSLTGVQTTYGDCGSILFLADPSWTQGKIIAMHVAAGTHEAYGRLIHREHYTEEVKCESIVSSPYISTEHATLIEADDALAVVHYPQHVPAKTKLYRNVYPIGPKEYEPAILGRNDTRNPGVEMLAKEAAKWCVPRQELRSEDKNLISIAVEQLANWYADVFIKEGVVLKTLTKMEAINKLSGCSTSEPIITKTSAGFPWSDITKEQGKKSYIMVDDDGIHRFRKGALQQKLFNAIDLYKLEAKSQAKASCVFKVFLKDEPVKLKKIYDDPKTRTIAAAPLDFQIVYRQYMHSAQAWLASNWHVLPPKVGINPLSLDYHTLYNTMASVSTEASDLDFQGWDFSIHPFILAQLPKFWNIIYRRCDPNWKEEDDAMRNVLYSKIVKFLILVGNKIVQTTGGIPSGYPGTTPDNSIINDLIGFVGYLKLVVKRNPCLSSISTFRQDVCTSTYGDDVLRTISPLVLHLYNTVTLAEYFKTLGFNPQPASKEGDFIAHRPLMECLFLSRSFRLWGSFVVGALLYDHLCKPTWWVHDSRSHSFWESPDEVCQNGETIRSCHASLLYEASLHPEPVFNKFRDVAMKVWCEYGGERPLTYDECHARMFNIATNLNGTFVPGVVVAEEIDILHLSSRHVPIDVKEFHNRRSWHFGKAYKYGNTYHRPVIIPNTLQKYLDYVNELFNKEFNSILINEYEPGGLIPWHKDDEPCLDLAEGVACLTLRGNGKMEWKSDSGDRFARYMSPGDIYLMEETNLRHFYHRRVDHTELTTTLTFRKLDT
uniref:Polyprotein n=1 Tax=Picornavirales sp. TaxID=1955153 RepID=A0A6M3YNZ0_9VIRU|nr:MAG: hypothetical protein 1 [Picornavirales sp.]